MFIDYFTACFSSMSLWCVVETAILLSVRTGLRMGEHEVNLRVSDSAGLYQDISLQAQVYHSQPTPDLLLWDGKIKLCQILIFTGWKMILVVSVGL